MKSVKNIAITLLVGAWASLPIFAFAQQSPLNAVADFIPVPNENAFQVRINSYSPKINLQFYAKYGEQGQPLTNTTSTFSLASTQPLPWTSSKIVIPGLKACTNYQFFVHVKSPDFPQYGEKAFGPYTYKTIGPCVSGTNNPTAPVSGTNNAGVPATDEGNPGARLADPLNNRFSNIGDLIKRIVEVVIIIAVPIVALMIIWSGFLIVTARGNEQKLSEGKKAFLAAVIGGVLVLGAYVLAQAIGSTVNQITG